MPQENEVKTLFRQTKLVQFTLQIHNPVSLQESLSRIERMFNAPTFPAPGMKGQ
jgi:hypothetical protein